MTQAVTTSFPFPRTAHFCPVGAKSGREPCFRLCSLEVGSIFPFVSQSPLLGIRLIIAHQIQCRIDLQFILCGLVENEAIQTHIPDDMQYSALWIQVIQAYFLISAMATSRANYCRRESFFAYSFLPPCPQNLTCRNRCIRLGRRIWIFT